MWQGPTHTAVLVQNHPTTLQPTYQAPSLSLSLHNQPNLLLAILRFTLACVTANNHKDTTPDFSESAEYSF